MEEYLNRSSLGHIAVFVLLIILSIVLFRFLDRSQESAAPASGTETEQVAAPQ